MDSKGKAGARAARRKGNPRVGRRPPYSYRIIVSTGVEQHEYTKFVKNAWLKHKFTIACWDKNFFVSVTCLWWFYSFLLFLRTLCRWERRALNKLYSIYKMQTKYGTSQIILVKYRNGFFSLVGLNSHFPIFQPVLSLAPGSSLFQAPLSWRKLDHCLIIPIPTKYLIKYKKWFRKLLLTWKVIC